VNFTLLPVCCSNFGASSAKTSFGAPPLMTWMRLKSPKIELMSPAQVPYFN
jgi:hypothetical protein